MIGHIDCDQHRDTLCRDVHSFPTIKTFREGTAAAYHGKRSFEALSLFVKKQTGPLVREAASREEVLVRNSSLKPSCLPRVPSHTFFRRKLMLLSFLRQALATKRRWTRRLKSWDANFSFSSSPNRAMSAAWKSFAWAALKVPCGILRRSRWTSL